MEQSSNPLAKHFRQPILYIKLPSEGAFWPEGSINIPINGEIPVLSMSTKDEIVLRTPDALLNGQGVVNVIESCCPAIKDAWQMPSIDVDNVIIAIRIASYGNQMDFSSKCPHCNETNDYAIDLGSVLSNITAPDYSKKVEVDNLQIKLKPQPYFSVNKTNQIEFEEQQIMRTLSTPDLKSDAIKAIFNEQLAKLISLNIEILSGSTAYIELVDGTIVSDIAYINEFYRNCDSKIVKLVKEMLSEMNTEHGLKPVPVVCNNEDCAKDFSVSITFDFASFFAVGS